MADTIETTPATDTDTDTDTAAGAAAAATTAAGGADRSSPDRVITGHRRACDRFTEVVAEGADRWDRLSPCDGWTAGDVVDHVIGFHDELLLQPTGTQPTALPDDDLVARWAVTVAAIRSAVDAAHAGAAGQAAVDLGGLLPALTAETLVHTWDLAMAIGVDPQLDPDLCAAALAFMRSNEEPMRASGLFGEAIAVPGSTELDPASQLVAFLGRDPAWSA